MSKGLERREFLKVLGVTGAGAGLAGCSGGQAEKLIPYVVPPEDIVPGVATWYRTTCRECPAGCGMSIRTREGRAVKAEGNPLSPISGGKLCARGQAALHGLYDPDRIPRPLAREVSVADWQPLSWDAAERQLTNALAQHRGRTAFLTQTFTGSLDRLLDDWCAAAGITRVRYDGFGWEPVRAASRLLFGFDAVPVHDFSNAEVVITFGADFLETWVSPVDYARGWVQSHAYTNGRRGTLISVSPHQSLTDLNADEWLPVRPGTEHLVALAMAQVIAEERGGAVGVAADALSGVDLNRAAEQAGVPAERIRAAAHEFARSGRSLAVGPGVSSTHQAATAVGVAVGILNAVAGNIGTTVRYDRVETGAGAGSYAQLQGLLENIRAGRVGALLVHGPNPLYEVPDGAAFAEALEQVPFIASFSPFLDETSARAHLLLPDHHFLESWADYVPRTGVQTLVQPVMLPVFRTKQTGDVLLSVARRAGLALPSDASTFYDYLREHWRTEVFPTATGAVVTSAAASTGDGFEDWWRGALQQGYVSAEPSAPGAAPVMAGGALARLRLGEPASFAGAGGAAEAADGTDEFFLVIYPSSRFYDGRQANRAWLQELPDPLSKISWGSWVEIHPNVADRLGLDIGHQVQVSTAAGRLVLPVWRHPGIREDCIAIQLGQGHREFGRYARDRGVNAVTLLRPQREDPSGALIYQQTMARLSATGSWERTAYTAGAATQDGRDVLQHVSLPEARAGDRARGIALGVLTAEEAQSTTAPSAGSPDTPAVPPGVVPIQAPAADEHGAAEDEHAAPGAHGEVHPSEAVVSQLQESGGFAPTTFPAGPAGYPPPGTYYGEYSHAQPRWAMAIDLERCIGCSACMTACYAENNIGIVGPELVANGRILSWIRIERYFREDGEAHPGEGGPGADFLPMLCQHCGQAPCEPVCPVYAAYHTPDGLNAQVYNRCVGTRYCANNCPYKVRYMNYFTYEWPEPLNWQLNPDVTVREKGVMEKCTFCVQRIRDAEQQARVAGRGVSDGEIVPACAQTCPGDAIVFGNIKDENSRVARIAASGRGYRVLEHSNTQSAITYLRKVVPATVEG
ncbi:MAG: 4Fe-4S dicluster domain-containing protein [Longimicrobiales bacterium]